MKYGVLMYFESKNIGDDVQSFAASRFLPSIDYFIDRENLDTFGLAKEQKPVSVIMNGWYMYNKFNWPPSSVINPLPISMHFSETDFFGIRYKFLDSIGGDYLKHYGPIGARDYATKEILRKKGIDAYYSGCLTLTINLPKPTEKTDDIILVDVDEKVKNVIFQAYPNIRFVEMSHDINTDDYPMFSGSERLKLVEERLKHYQKSKCVITTRLHCALPCLALGVPVLLIYKEENMNRFQPFLPLLHTTEIDKMVETLKDYDITNPPQNYDKYLPIRKRLEEKCKRFIHDAENGIIKPSFEVPLEDVHLWQKELMKGANRAVCDSIEELTRWIQELEKGKEWNVEQLKLAQARLKKYEKWKGLFGMGEKGIITELKKRHFN